VICPQSTVRGRRLQPASIAGDEPFDRGNAHLDDRAILLMRNIGCSTRFHEDARALDSRKKNNLERDHGEAPGK